jgi:hypothetical protein
MLGLIGNGLIGRRLRAFLPVDHVFTRANISSMANYQFDIMYCAAPSGNRIWADQNPTQDTESCKQLIQNLKLIKDTKLILISTGDTQVRPDTVYGGNRLKLENCIKDNFKQYHIVRLPSLIGADITKNMLYDIKHNTPWVDKINADAWLQWYPLDRLRLDLSALTELESNLCSEPIQGWEIVNKFVPNLKLSPQDANLRYDLNPYSVTKQEVFIAIEEYLK